MLIHMYIYLLYVCVFIYYLLTFIFVHLYYLCISLFIHPVMCLHHTPETTENVFLKKKNSYENSCDENL